MPRPRKALVSKADTPYYHCVSRCVRRAFLCGKDHQSGKCYEHRRAWVVERLHLLSSVFAIDVCAYAVMSNHYHLVLKLDSSENWADDEVIARWRILFQGPLLIKRYMDGSPLNTAQRQSVTDIAHVWRQRLQDLSWFMKCLNEPIARQANAEDNCTGHFWESRFKSQALRTEQSLLAAMAYVDLNPIRARVASTPETSDFTSIQQRLSKSVNAKILSGLRSSHPGAVTLLNPEPLLQFEHGATAKDQTGIPFTFLEYVQLVDWTGRQTRPGKRGAISPTLPPILHRLKVEPERWLINSQRFEEVYILQFRRAA